MYFLHSQFSQNLGTVHFNQQFKSDLTLLNATPHFKTLNL